MSVVQQLAGKHLLVTGFTGFLGKVFVGLLLEHVEAIGHITLLVRPRGRRGALGRVEMDFDTSPVFRALREAHGPGLGAWLGERLSVVQADVERPLCGVSSEDLASLRGADLLVHCAGLTDFQPDPLRALAINVGGALHGAELAQRLGVPMLHVSTAFVAGMVSGQIPESLTPGLSPLGVRFDPAAELRSLQLVCRRGRSVQERVDAAMERARHLGWPNIYTFTKGLAEHLLAGRPGLTVVRPSIVECARSYPFAGWNEGLNTAGPLAWLITTAFRRLPARAEHQFDVVPVDDVAKGMASVAAAMLRGEGGGIYHLASGDRAPLNFGRTVELTGLAARRFVRKGGGKAIDRLYRQLDPIPVASEAPGLFEVGRLRTWTDRFARAVDRLDRQDLPRLVDRTLGEEVDSFRKEVKSLAADTTEKLRRIDDMLDLFKPFIHDHDYHYDTDRIYALNPQAGPFVFDMTTVEWREYWIDVEYPGLQRWSIPVMRGERPPRDRASTPPLRIVAGPAAERVASK